MRHQINAPSSSTPTMIASTHSAILSFHRLDEVVEEDVEMRQVEDELQERQPEAQERHDVAEM